MIITTGVVSVYFVTGDPTKVVTDLSVDSSPIYKFLDLSWSHPSSLGLYYVYWLVEGEWVYSGSSTSSTSIRTSPPSDAVSAQIRTDDLHPSNVIDIVRVTPPETRVLSGTARYDGVLLDWDPNTLGSEKVAVERDNTTVFTGSVSSYLSEFGGAFKVRFFKGIGSDVVYGDYSNTITLDKLVPPPARVEPSAPCDFYLGVNRAGQQIMHICNPSVVPDTPPVVETGKDSVDWFQDWVGVNVDYGDDTYFHSKFSYVYCTTAVRITTYSDVFSTASGYIRKFDFNDAISVSDGTASPYTPSNRLVIVVLVNSVGTRQASNPILTRTIEQAEDNVITLDNYSQGDWGYGESSGYFTSGIDYIRTTQDTVAIEIYEFNLEANGRDLDYVPQTGIDNGIKLNPDEFEVAGNSFDSMMLSYAGTGTDGEYVNTMNLSDSILPMGGSVDTLGIYNGSANNDIMQVLGSSGGSGWDIDMETGSIKRGGKYWFNAGRGRTRIQYTGKSTGMNTSPFSFAVPVHTTNNQGVGVVSQASVASNRTVLVDSTLTEPSRVLGFTITPTDWFNDDTGWTELYTTDNKGVVGFSSFSSRVPILRMVRRMRADEQVLPSGDPYWTVWYELTATFYLKKASDSLFVIEFDYDYYSFDGSGGLEREFSVPGFSFSFIGLS